MDTNRKVSVLMGVYNCADTLEQAVNAILNQTYTNWELILCDDGSTDNTYEVARKLQKDNPKIILLSNEHNCGLNKTLNKCLAAASGDFIARMDGDDDCALDRFQKQVDFLESQDDYAIVSSCMTFFDENGVWGRNYSKETPQPADLISGSPICHAPVMMWRKCMLDVGGYTEDKRMLRVEDVNLWIKLYAAGYRCYNIQEPLYRMRNDKSAFQRRKYKYRINSTYVRLLGCRILHLGPMSYASAFKPMIVGLMPERLRRFIKHKNNTAAWVLLI